MDSAMTLEVRYSAMDSATTLEAYIVVGSTVHYKEDSAMDSAMTLEVRYSAVDSAMTSEAHIVVGSAVHNKEDSAVDFQMHMGVLKGTGFCVFGNKQYYIWAPR